VRKWFVLVFAAAMLWSSVAFAATLAGVTMPNKAKVDGQELVLNGLGLREKFMFDVYVGGLYLPSKSKNAKSIISDNVHKRVVMHFVRDVDKDKLAETLDESLAKAKGVTKAQRAKMRSWMQDVSEGDQIVIDYVPGKGTSFVFKHKGKSKHKGTIEGEPFMRGIMSIYVGPNPADEQLKKGMLGKR